MDMIASWTSWKLYPNAARGESIQAPIGPGLFEVREAQSGAVFASGVSDNVAVELARLTQRSGGARWFSRRERTPLPDLEYRTYATASLADAKAAASVLFARREAFFGRAA